MVDSLIKDAERSLIIINEQNKQYKKAKPISREEFERYLTSIDEPFIALGLPPKARECYKNMPQVKITKTGFCFNRASIEALCAVDRIRLKLDLVNGVIRVLPALSNDTLGLRWVSTDVGVIKPLTIHRNNEDLYSAMNWETTYIMKMYTWQREDIESLKFQLRHAYISQIQSEV